MVPTPNSKDHICMSLLLLNLDYAGLRLELHLHLCSAHTRADIKGPEID